MKTILLENLRKRIIFTIIGIAGYYLIPAAIIVVFIIWRKQYTGGMRDMRK